MPEGVENSWYVAVSRLCVIKAVGVIGQSENEDKFFRGGGPRPVRSDRDLKNPTFVVTEAPTARHTSKDWTAPELVNDRKCQSRPAILVLEYRNSTDELRSGSMFWIAS